MAKEKEHSKIFKSRVDSWIEKIRVAPTQIRIQSMTRKWASCSTCGWVTFSKDLLDEEKDFQDYVIVHELLHLKVPNHGKLFKSLFSLHFPQWKMFFENDASELKTKQKSGHLFDAGVKGGPGAGSLNKPVYE